MQNAQKRTRLNHITHTLTEVLRKVGEQYIVMQTLYMPQNGNGDISIRRNQRLNLLEYNALSLEYKRENIYV